VAGNKGIVGVGGMKVADYDGNADGTVDSADLATAVDEDSGVGPPSGAGTAGRPYFDTTNNKRYMPRPGALTTWDLVSG